MVCVDEYLEKAVAGPEIARTGEAPGVFLFILEVSVHGFRAFEPEVAVLAVGCVL
jgi:hypothetical protein